MNDAAPLIVLSVLLSLYLCVRLYLYRKGKIETTSMTRPYAIGGLVLAAVFLFIFITRHTWPLLVAAIFIILNSLLDIYMSRKKKDKRQYPVRF